MNIGPSNKILVHTLRFSTNDISTYVLYVRNENKYATNIDIFHSLFSLYIGLCLYVDNEVDDP